MKLGRYLLVAVILVFVLGLFLIMGTIANRRAMMALIKDEARSVLSLVALTQENSIFAEQKLEDEVISELFNVVDYFDKTGCTQAKLNDITRSFDFTSIVVFRKSDGRILYRSGTPFSVTDSISPAAGNIYYEYFTFHVDKYLRFICRLGGLVYQIELSARDITRFSEEYGINKILTQISANPMIRYLALQDPKGIIFATHNLKTLSKIEGDAALERVLAGKEEVARIVGFENKSILEIAQPFTVAERVVGIFRIGINLDSYNQYTRKTLIELIALFITLFVLGFFLYILSMKYQNYLDLKELFARSLGGIEEGIILFDRAGKVTGVNHMFCTLSGLEEKALLHHGYREIFPEDVLNINYVLANRTRIEEEKELFGRRIQYVSYPLFKKAGAITGVIAMIRDVTRIREFEREQKESERLSFLGNLVANFAHEIKNPLNGLSIAAQRLAREFPSDHPEYKNLTEILRKEIGSLNQVLNDFLGLVRPHVKEEVFDLNQVLKDAVNIVREQVREKGDVLVEKITGHVKMTGHPEEMKRAFLNILVNSVDAVFKTRGQTGEIGIELRPGKEITVEIWDNGIGIDQAELDRIFTPYFTTKKGGTGLGLFIAQKTIKDHGGKIAVTSTKGSGTRFTITFSNVFST